MGNAKSDLSKQVSICTSEPDYPLFADREDSINDDKWSAEIPQHSVKVLLSKALTSAVQQRNSRGKKRSDVFHGNYVRDMS